MTQHHIARLHANLIWTLHADAFIYNWKITRHILINSANDNFYLNFIYHKLDAAENIFQNMVISFLLSCMCVCVPTIGITAHHLFQFHVCHLHAATFVGWKWKWIFFSHFDERYARQQLKAEQLSLYCWKIVDHFFFFFRTKNFVSARPAISTMQSPSIKFQFWYATPRALFAVGVHRKKAIIFN